MLSYELLILLTFLWVPYIHGRKIPDWLVKNITVKAQIVKLQNGNILLTNRLISREFSVTPDFATVDYYSYEKQSSLLRALGPEAIISLDGIKYNIGGVNTSIPRAYLNRTALADDMRVDSQAFHYVSHSVQAPKAPYSYKPRRGAPPNIAWPPRGLRLDVEFEAPVWAPVYHKKVGVTIHYEMYEGIPVMSKWITVSAQKEVRNQVKLGVLSVERLAVNWQWSEKGYKWLYIQANRPHGINITWAYDPMAGRMPGSFQQNVDCSYSLIPFLNLDQEFVSFKVLELVIGSSDPERTGLAKRRMLRVLAPQTQENPLLFHTTRTDSKSVRALFDQMAEVGFEMLEYSFGSGFNYESDNETYIKGLAEDIAYARSKGIEVGGYDLIARTRRVEPKWMAKYKGIPSACFASGWYDYLSDRILNMMNKTGMSFIDTDGTYHGYTCSSTNHSHHQGYQDSVYQQDQLQGRFFTILKERGVYVNQPDHYFYQGTSKTGMGYNEHQFSLPRWQDISISRQGMFDDTFHYTPTVGGMFLPIDVYHGGGAAAAFAPLSKHLIEYEWALAQYMGAGVISVYRGHELYDDPKSKALVKKWVSFFKKYRDIVTSDIIHVRRADMQHIDCFLHVNPFLNNKALAMMFNPTNTDQTLEISLPLYYSGLSSYAMVSQEGGIPVRYYLDREYNIDITVKLPALGITWYIIQAE